jgi:hypothetical protein
VNDEILAGDDQVLDTTSSDNDMEMERVAKQKKLHCMAKAGNIFEIWQGSHNLRATPKESCSLIKQTTAVGYISDTKEIVKASWLLFQHDGAAAFKLSENSTGPPAFYATGLPGGRTQVFNVHQTR